MNFELINLIYQWSLKLKPTHVHDSSVLKQQKQWSRFKKKLGLLEQLKSSETIKVNWSTWNLFNQLNSTLSIKSSRAVRDHALGNL